MSNKISQKQAVINEVMNILGSSYDPLEPAKQQLTPAQIRTIKDNIFTGITNGSISYNKDINNHSEVKAYIPGLVSNHFRKAKELNGGFKYSSKTKKAINESNDSDPTVKLLQEKLQNLNPGTPEYQNTILAINHAKDFSKRVNKELKNLNTEVMPEEIKDLTQDLVDGIVQ